VRNETIRRIEFLIGILLSLIAVAFISIRATHAGGLWRDECDSVATATMPTFSELLHYFQFDSFPLPFALVLRGYVAVAGNNDTSMRVFGALVGLSLLLIGWWYARRLRTGAPLIFLAFAVLNPTFLIWGTTVRGYGLGCVIIVFALAATANFLADRTTRNAFLMAIAFVAAVQCLVSNTALVFAICLGGISACFFRSDRKTALIIAGALGVAALSYSPYLATYSKMGWHILLQTNASLAALWDTFRDSLGAHNPAAAIAWIALPLIAAIPWILWTTRDASSLSIFAPFTALFSLAGGFIFLYWLSYTPQNWYFLPLICLLAGALELTIAAFAGSAVVRIIRLLVCLIAVAGTSWSSWPSLITRQSNVDLIANWLGSNAEGHDLIIVNPWYFGVSFNRYYHGVAPWLTVPLLSDLRIHRYDLLREKMSEEDPLQEIRPTIEETLRNGGRIYLAGGAKLLEENERAIELPPAPRSQYGWNYLPYVVAWSQELGKFLQAHVQHSAELPQLGAEENIPLWEVEGWHD